MKKMDMDYIQQVADQIEDNIMISYDDLPKYDLFLSQVIDFLNDKFIDDKYTNNIVQNYIKSEVISKPEDGKKRGYTKIHLVQLVLLSYMRPILTTEEIKKVFSLAFNEINDRSDDIISWETAYKIFSETQSQSIKEGIAEDIVDEENLNNIIKGLNLNEKDEYLKLYDPQLDNKVKNPLFKIMYLILNEEYEEALELSKKVTSQQKDIGYIMKLYYRIICLEHLEKENELNDCINEMVEFNDQIHYVKEIKDKYKK